MQIDQVHHVLGHPEGLILQDTPVRIGERGWVSTPRLHVGLAEIIRLISCRALHVLSAKSKRKRPAGHSGLPQGLPELFRIATRCDDTPGQLVSVVDVNEFSARRYRVAVR